MRNIVLFFFTVGILFSTVFAEVRADSQKIKVLSTIKPIHAIVIAIAGGRVSASQLIPDYVSPHNYSFKPSDLRRIKKADIIFRIDENMEMMLSPALEKRKKQSRLVSLADEAEIKMLPFPGSQASSHGHDADGHNHGKVDLHIWTSPDNSIAMAKVIADSLSKADPKNKDGYQANLKKYSDSMQVMAKKIKQELAPVMNKSYIVFHPSWQYFAHYFGLKEPEIISLQHGISAGVKTIREARAKIASKGVVCVMSEPGISEARVNTLTENLNLKTTEIDVLQAHYKIDENTSTQWLAGMAKRIRSCLE